MEILETLEVIGNAQELGFTLDKIKTLLNAFLSEQEPAQKCQELAHQKILELEELVARANKMKRILYHGMTCRCTSLQGCYVNRDV